MSQQTFYKFWCPLPPRVLAANYKAATVKDRINQGKERMRYRQDCEIAIRGARIPPCNLIKVTMRFETGTPKGLSAYFRSYMYFPLDIQNAIISTKPLIDAFIYAGVVSNDDSKHVKIGECDIVKSSPPGIQVMVECLEFKEVK